ncbi:MAG: signal peptidase II [Rhodospirillaceae bacterium]|nr:signal peptidase II [Rhodospirillaceae bacterium]
MNTFENNIAKLRMLGLGIALIVFILDQLSKWWMLTEVMPVPTVMRITSFFNLVIAYNRGISFGMFGASSDMGSWVLIAIAVVIVAFLLNWLMKGESLLSVLATGLIIGGALGNVADRIRFGAVVDFLDFHIGSSHWPAFNVADTAITLGAAALILEALKPEPEQPKNNTVTDTDHNQSEKP